MKFRRLGLSFNFRLTFWYACILAVASFGLFTLFDRFLEESVTQSERQILMARSQEYRAWFEEGGLSALKARFDERRRLGSEPFFIRVVGPGRNALFYSIPNPKDIFDFRLLDEKASKKTASWISLKSYESDSLWHVLSTPLGLNYSLQVGSNSSRERKLQSEMRSIFWKVVLPFLLFGILGGGFLTFRAIRPIQKLSETIQGILNTGQRHLRVPESRHREDLDRLGRSFNKLLDQNEKLIDRMRLSLDSVAHDLRTPMTRLRQSAELALQGEKTADIYQEALQDCLEESESILKTLDVLMEVAEAETGTMNLHQEEFSLNEMIHKLIELYELIAEDKNIQFQIHLNEDIHLVADKIRIQQAIANLIDNSIKYIGTGNLITISAMKAKNKTTITVEDNGMGIPSEDIPKIWDRLFRGDKSRSERGLGIGLSFVKAIIEAHEGQIDVESEVGKGSKFTITLS